MKEFNYRECKNTYVSSGKENEERIEWEKKFQNQKYDPELLKRYGINKIFYIDKDDL